MMMWKGLSFALVLLVVVSCGETNVGKPQSVGEAYDVTVVSADKKLLAMAKGMLNVEMEGLPQRERLYNVKTANSGMTNAATQYGRVLVLVRIAGSHTRVRYERNPYAKSQLLLFVETPSEGVLRADSARTARTLQRLIGQFETKEAMDYDSQNHNLKLMREVEKNVGCKITVPSGMSMSKPGKNFLWISDNGQPTMRNVCVYAVSGIRTSAAEIVSVRDSVMAANVKGEREGMEMATERRTEIFYGRQGKGFVIRGLWQMKGDAMGGPFISFTLADSARNRTVTAEAFIYAPSTTKAKALKRLEATLYTLKIE